MKKYCFSLCVFFLFNCSKEDVFILKSKIAIGKIESISTYGGSKNDVATSVIQTTDGGYVVLGYTQSADGDITDKLNESFDLWLMKFNALHEIVWSKTLGGTDTDKGNQIIQTNDGGFAVLGLSESNDQEVATNAGSEDFWMVKLTSEGIITWEKTFGYLGADYGTTLMQTNDNGYLLAGVIDVSASGGQGNARNFNHAGGDIWAIKLSNTGNLEWSKYYGGSFTDIAYGIAKTADNGFVIVGSSDSDDVDIHNYINSYDFWVIRISSIGNLVWEKSYGGSEIDEARAIISTNDGNFIIVGDTRSSDYNVSINKGAADLWMLKINPQGTIIWEKTLGGSSFDVARSISKTQDNGFLISGSSRSSDGDITTNNKGQNDAWVLKTSSEGSLLWQTTFGGSEIDFCYDAVELNNGTIVAVGESNSSNGEIIENKGFSDALIVLIK